MGTYVDADEHVRSFSEGFMDVGQLFRAQKFNSMNPVKRFENYHFGGFSHKKSRNSVSAGIPAPREGQKSLRHKVKLLWKARGMISNNVTPPIHFLKLS